MNEKPVIAVTMGDPAGIGPEICLRVLAEGVFADTCRLAVIGSLSILRRVAETTGIALPDVPVRGIGDPRPYPAPACIEDLPMQGGSVTPGVCSASCGQAAFDCVAAAVRAALEGRVSALATGPINKKSLNMAGHAYAGHTEILAEMTGTDRYCMMLTADALTVSFVTTHLRYANVPGSLTAARVTEVIELTAEALGRIRKRAVRLGVCALNPHAGEQGLFGSEETELIVPGIEAARGRGIDVEGPLPPDTAFTEGVRRRFDGVICQYHDQGHIPFKMLAFETGVNVTLGLPIVRTSVDHGTAFDIAWQGIASPVSLSQAIRLAVELGRL